MMTADDAADWAELAERVSTAAGQLILRERREGRLVETLKDAGELVTSADLASDELIRAATRERYRDHQILSEEDPAEPPATDGPLWIVDPLDGTVNYSRGLPHFAVAVAVTVGGTLPTSGAAARLPPG